MPFGGVCAVKAVGATTAALMLMLMLTVFTLPKAFCAFTTIPANTPLADGVPEITPAPLKVNPAGNAPETSEYAGAGKPFAISV